MAVWRYAVEEYPSTQDISALQDYTSVKNVDYFVREGDGASGWDGDEEVKAGQPVRLLSPSRDRRMNMLS